MKALFIGLLALLVPSVGFASEPAFHLYGLARPSEYSGHADALVIAAVGGASLPDELEVEASTPGAAVRTQAQARDLSLSLSPGQSIRFPDGASASCPRSAPEGSCASPKLYRVALSDATRLKLSNTLPFPDLRLSFSTQGRELGSVRLGSSQWSKLLKLDIRVKSLDDRQVCFELASPYFFDHFVSAGLRLGPTGPFEAGYLVEFRQFSPDADRFYRSVQCMESDVRKALLESFASGKTPMASLSLKAQLFAPGWDEIALPPQPLSADLASTGSIRSLKNGLRCAVYKRSAAACGDGSLGRPYDSAGMTSRDPSAPVRIPYRIELREIDEVSVQLSRLPSQWSVPEQVDYEIRVRSGSWGAEKVEARGQLSSMDLLGKPVIRHELLRVGSGSFSGSSCYHTVVRLSCELN